MSSPKKTSPKTKSPAPATKPAAVKPAAAAKPAAAKKATAAATTVASAAPSPLAAVKPAVAPAPVAAKPAAAASVAPVKPVSAKPHVTTITARIDVGYGNALFIRGEGPGLSWDKGVPMECVWSDSWMAVLGEAARPYTFKFLINDQTWSNGPDYTAASGGSVTLTPEF